MDRQSIALRTLAIVIAGMPLGALAQDLPEGKGKELVASTCTACHQSNLITRSSGYSRDDWKALTSTMINLSGSPEQQGEILDYLASHFPPNKTRTPKLVPGTVELTFKEYVAPSLGQRTRDPVEAKDGAIWYAGQFGNVLGRIDPATGAIKEWTLPPKSLPHTVVLDANDTPWFTGNANGTIGKLDPATGKATVYKMPDPKARDPHTAVFDKDGILWFSLQQSNMFGRLDPATGDIKLVTSKTTDSKPYGVKIDADGNPWFSCNGAPCLMKVDRKTMEMTEFKLPQGSTVRRLDIAADGMVWYVNSSLGRLGRLDPKTGQITEWTSPSGARSHPYAIVVDDGIVWYNESNMRPDALVRFDPKTEKFQSWAIPSGSFYAGHIRHMRAARNGDLLVHQSSTNRVIRVSVKQPPAVR
jgi:virginiamycin B lyase